MANNSEDKPNAFAATLEDAKAAAEQGVTELKKQVDGVLTEAASHLVAGGVVAADTLRQGLDVANKLADEGKGLIGQGVAQIKAVEDVVITEIKCGLDLIQKNPYVSYPVLATGGLLLLPGTRRLLYRATLGRLRSVDNIIKSSEGKVEGLRVKMTDYDTEAKKLQDRMVAAEEEFLRGRAKLKATRQELQRLASVVTKSERAAAGVLEDLRSIRKVDRAVTLRAEAASQVSALKSQRSALQQYIYRIATKDV